MKRSNGVLFTLTFLLLFLPWVAHAQIPREISYQGVLTDSLGIPKQDGSYSFVFTLSSDSTGVNVVWNSGTQTLLVKNGLFSTVLSFPSTVAFDRKYWLGISVGAQSVSPRIPMSSVAYSIASIRSDTAGYALSGLGGGTTYTAGSGLTLTGSVFSIATGGVTNQMLRDSSLTITPGSGLSGGGAVSLGNSVTISHAPHTGDVSGTQSLTVIGLQGRGVDSTPPPDGYVLKWNNTNSRWGPSPDISGGAGGIGGSGGDNSIAKFRGATTLESSAIYDSAGNIGIGTTSPQSRLDVAGTVQMTGFTLSSTPSSGYVLTSDAFGVGSWQQIPAGGSVTSIGSGTPGIQAGASGLTFSSNPITTTGTISIANAGVRNVMLANSSVTVSPGTGLSGGGTVALGGTVSLSVASQGITSNEILDNTIDSIDIGRDAVGTDELGPGSVVLGSTDVTGILGTNQGGTGNSGFPPKTVALVDDAGNLIGNPTVLSWNPAGGGVGIGIPVPQAQLHVVGLAGGEALIVENLQTPGPGDVAVTVDPSTGAFHRTGSSRRYKDNIRPLETDFATVLRLKPVRFTWKSSGAEDIGLIAEEVSEVMKDLVIYNAQGNPESVKYDKVALYLLEVVKAQQGEIDNLRASVNSLLAKAANETDGSNVLVGEKP